MTETRVTVETRVESFECILLHRVKVDNRGGRERAHEPRCPGYQVLLEPPCRAGLRAKTVTLALTIRIYRCARCESCNFPPPSFIVFSKIERTRFRTNSLREKIQSLYRAISFLSRLRYQRVLWLKIENRKNANIIINIGIIIKKPKFQIVIFGIGWSIRSVMCLFKNERSGMFQFLCSLFSSEFCYLNCLIIARWYSNINN